MQHSQQNRDLAVPNPKPAYRQVGVRRKSHAIPEIEAVTSHGPVSPKRQKELAELFKACTDGLV